MSEKISHRKTGTFVPSNSGNRFRPVYELDQETETFIEKGRIDLKEYINSGFVETDLYSLIDRYKNVEEFNQRGSQVFYGDVTQMPKNMFDLPPVHVIESLAAQAVQAEAKKGLKDGKGTNPTISEESDT